MDAINKTREIIDYLNLSPPNKEKYNDTTFKNCDLECKWQRISDLEIFLNKKLIDICLISESHFTRTLYAKIRGYQCYQALHSAQKGRGGTAIFNKDIIKHQE